MDDRLGVRVELGALLPDALGDDGRQQGSGSQGKRFEVICIRPGKANGLSFSPEVLQRSLQDGLWQGLTVFMDHAAPSENGRRVRDVAGVLEHPTWNGQAVIAQLRTCGPQAETVQRLASEVLAAVEAGQVAPNIGLSADLLLCRDSQRNVTRIVRVNSVDVVYDPAAGGAFVRALNATAQSKSGEHPRPQPNGGSDMTDQKTPLAESDQVVVAQSEPQAGEELASMRQMYQASCTYMLDMALAASDLPLPLKDEVRAQFSQRSFRPEELQRAIQAKRDTWARLVEAQVVRGAGPSGTAGAAAGREPWQLRDSLDQVRLAAYQLFGLPVPENARITRLSGVRELYHKLTGDLEFRGQFDPERVTLANADTSTMANITADVLNKVLLQAYNRRERWWEPIVANRDLNSLHDMKMIRVYGFSALSTVGEGAPYTEKTWDDLQETASVVKKGNYIGITLEMLMADDVQAVRAVPELLGSAAYNTVADAVAAVFTSNSGAGPTMADGTSLFHATRGNLGSAALASASFDAAQLAIMSQTEPGSLRKLGVPGRFLLVPVQLRSTAMVIRNSQYQPGSSNNDVNPWYQGFEVVPVPAWSDANDWAVATDPNQAEHIVLGWLQGRREPEIFAATDAQSAAMFTNDEMRLKVRFFICCGVADYRGLYKANVA